jgi:hypothetical protein
MVRSIPASTYSSLGYYVYLYVDPRTDAIFYVGQGKGGRALAHLKDRSQSDKVARLDELNRLGLEPRIEILRYGLTQEEALHVEAAAIELLGISELTNQVLGHGFDRKRRTTLEDLVHELSAEEVAIKHSVLLINISQMYRYGMSAVELYDATRKSWRVGPRREQIEYVMAVHRGVIREVYRVAAWLPANSTMTALGTTSNIVGSEQMGDDIELGERYEFVGRVAESAVRKRYLGKSVRHYLTPGSQNPIKYI